MTRTQKVEIALKLRSQGRLIREIADELGVAYTTASSYITDPYLEKHRRRIRGYGGWCIDCGNPTNGSDGPGKAPKRCLGCNAKWVGDQLRIWTREALIDAAQKYAAQYGHPPSARDWNPAMAREDYRDDIAERFYEDGCWPNYSTVQRYFRRWNAFIEAAGFQPLRPGHKYVDRNPHASQVEVL